MEKDILKQLYQKYRKEIYLYLYSLCKNSSLAEDLLQETFLKALLSLPDDHTNMRAWLYLVMQYFGGLSQKEIAAILKMTPENVRVLSYRAKRELRTYMEDHNYDLS